MNLIKLAKLINYSFQYVTKTSELYHIDESHSLRHSMDVFHYANEIYQSEINQSEFFLSPFLQEQQKIIFCSAILHDMCDKKYMDESVGVAEMKKYMEGQVTGEELDIIIKIVTTMSYSTVKKNGYPDLGIYTLAYHIVREADLLAAYDIERCIIYKMKQFDYEYLDALQEMKTIFESRILLYIQDNLFVTEYSKKKAKELHNQCIIKLEEIDKIYFSDNK
jgi:HD superfamily phosphodiesterase